MNTIIIPTVDPKDLLAGLQSVMFAMSKDKTRPHLNGVQLVSDTNRLSFTCSDGHRAHEFTLKTLSNLPKVITRFITSDEATSLVSALKDLVKKNRYSVELELRQTYSKQLLVIKDLTAQTEQQFLTVDSDFPNLSRVVPGPATGTRGSFLCANMNYFGDLGKVQKLLHQANSDLRIGQSDSVPYVIRVGESFRAVIMPCRTDVNMQNLDEAFRFACQQPLEEPASEASAA